MTAKYISLFGDDIQAGLIRKALTSSDAKATGLAAIFVAANETLIGDPQNMGSSVIQTLQGNLIRLAVSRLFIEKIPLLFFNIETSKSGKEQWTEEDRTKDICIDTAPGETAVEKSLEQYWRPATYARSMYMGALAMYGISTAVQSFGRYAALMTTDASMTPDDLNAYADRAAMFTRMYMGFQRFNRVVNGEWAIITRPPVEIDEPVLAPRLQPARIPASRYTPL